MGSNSIEDIARGVKEILHQINVKMPSTKVILLGVFPRNEPEGSKAKKLNVLLKPLADERTVYWLDMWNTFEGADGKPHLELYDGGKACCYLHLTQAGYEAWHRTMEPLLSKLL